MERDPRDEPNATPADAAEPTNPLSVTSAPPGSLLRRVYHGYKQIEADEALKEAYRKYRAIVAPAKLDSAEAEAVLDQFLAGREVQREQLFALGLALRALRPGLFVSGDTVEGLPSRCAASFPQWDGFIGKVRPHLRAVGRIDGPGKNDRPVPYGTGFLIKPDLLLTNRHVASELSHGTGVLPPGRATVNFTWEYDILLGDTIGIDSIAYLDESGLLDLALLRLTRPAGSTEQCLRFSAATATAETSIAVVGYPAESSDRNPAFISTIFTHHLGIKRVSPGQVSLRMVGRPVFCHDASTLGGSSGSPVLSLDDASVLGVHCGGHFLDANEAIDGKAAVDWLPEAFR